MEISIRWRDLTKLVLEQNSLKSLRHVRDPLARSLVTHYKGRSLVALNKSKTTKCFFCFLMLGQEEAEDLFDADLMPINPVLISKAGFKSSL